MATSNPRKPRVLAFTGAALLAISYLLAATRILETLTEDRPAESATLGFALLVGVHLIAIVLAGVHVTHPRATPTLAIAAVATLFTFASVPAALAGLVAMAVLSVAAVEARKVRREPPQKFTSSRLLRP